MKPVEILTEARSILETKGWCKGHFRKDTGERCLLGAIREAAGRYDEPPRDEDYDAYFTAMCTVTERVPSHSGLITYFNDNHSTTYADVLDVLDKSIASLEGE